MPIYRPQSPAPQSADPWAEQAKRFMSSPSFADAYMARLANPTPPPMAGQMNNMSPIPNGWTDRDWLAGALQAEGAGYDDKRYIANVIGNRLASGRWGNTLKDVILAPGQFSAFNSVTGYAGGEQGSDHWRNPTPEAYQIADALIGGQLPDATGGAMNYYRVIPGVSGVPAWGGSGFRRLPGSPHYWGTAY